MASARDGGEPGFESFGTRASARGGGSSAAMSGGDDSAGGLSKSAARDKPLISFRIRVRWTGSRIVRRSCFAWRRSGSRTQSKAPVLDGVNARVTLSSRASIVAPTAQVRRRCSRTSSGSSLRGRVPFGSTITCACHTSRSTAMHHLEATLDTSPKEYIQKRFFLGRDKELAAMATMEMSEEDKAQMKRQRERVRDPGTGDEGRQPVLRGAKDRRPPGVTRGGSRRSFSRRRTWRR